MNKMNAKRIKNFVKHTLIILLVDFWLVGPETFLGFLKNPT